MQNFSYENEFDLHENEITDHMHFHFHSSFSKTRFNTEAKVFSEMLFLVAKASVKDPIMLTWNVRGITALFQCLVCCLNSNSPTLVFNLVARRLRVVDDISLLQVFIICFFSLAINIADSLQKMD